MAGRVFPQEKNMDLKSIQVNESNSVTRMAKRGVDMQIDYFGRQFLDALSTWRGFSG